MDTAKNFKGFNLMRSKGFTLIELLVGITVTSIVFSIGYSGFREFSRRQALTGVVKATTSDLRQIQQLALTGQKPSGVTCLKLVGYQFVRTGSSTYELQARCDNTVNVATPLFSSPIIKSVTLNGTTFTAAPSTTILFKVLGQGTSLSAINNLVFTHTATNSTATVNIGIGGDVKTQ